MPTLQRLLDKAKTIRQHPSDASLADDLGVTRQAVHAWRNGGNIAPEHLLKLIEYTKESPDTLQRVLLERE